MEAAFTKDAPDTKTGIVLQGGPLDEPALGMYAATQILRSAVGELTIDYLRGAPQPARTGGSAARGSGGRERAARPAYR